MTYQNPEIPPLPEEEDYMQSVVTVGKRIIAARKSLPDFISEYGRRRWERSEDMLEYLFHAYDLGSYLEHRNVLSGDIADPNRLTTTAVLAGAAVGAMIIHEAHGEALPLGEIYENLPYVGESAVENPIIERNRVRNKVMRLGLGETGIGRLGEHTKDVVSIWANMLTPAPVIQTMFKVSIGIGLFGAYRTHEQLGIRQFAQSVQGIHDVDWNKELDRLQDGK